MSYQPEGLSVLAHALEHTQYVYRTLDPFAVVAAPHYFAAARAIFGFGDVLTLVCSDGTAIRWVAPDGTLGLLL